jgi:hypothetical protein
VHRRGLRCQQVESAKLDQRGENGRSGHGAGWLRKGAEGTR